MKRHGTDVPCLVTAGPVTTATDAEVLLAVTFQDAASHEKGTTTAAGAADRHRRADDATMVRHLAQELKATRDDL